MSVKETETPLVVVDRNGNTVKVYPATKKSCIVDLPEWMKEEKNSPEWDDVKNKPEVTNGQDGKDGATWYSGNAAPDGASGVEGDFYFNETTGDIYKKTESGWGEPICNITGPQGEQGRDGEAPIISISEDGYWTINGVKSEVKAVGTDGKDGENGKPGRDGKDGEDGSDGKNGENGKSAFELYQQEHPEYQGSLEEWLESLKGKDGANGQDGAPGADGATLRSGSSNPGISIGAVGDYYINTTTGDIFKKASNGWGAKIGNFKGPQGETGENGKNGKDGVPGVKGTDGTDGKDGATWHDGSSTPASSIGVVGDYYLNSSTGDVYKKSSSGWGSPICNLKGPRGEQGEDGQSETDANPVYDLVIRTQEEFDAWVGDLEADSCGAHSVLLVGDGGGLEFDTEGRTLRLPEHLYRLDGINNAKIIMRLGNVTGSCLYYDMQPTDGLHSISGLTVICLGEDVGGFYKCAQLSRCNVLCYASLALDDGNGYSTNICRAFENCVNLFDCSCDIQALSENTGFLNCNKVSRCAAFCSMGELENRGFSNCTQLSDCSSFLTDAATCYFFVECEQLSNCSCVDHYNGGAGGSSYAYAFTDCSFTNGCKYTDAPATSWTEVWHGTNDYRDDSSCEID